MRSPTCDVRHLRRKTVEFGPPPTRPAPDRRPCEPSSIRRRGPDRTAPRLAAVPGTAGPEKIAFPARYKDHVLYATVDRYDNKQYRELYGTPEAVKAAREGKPIPSGTVLTLIQYKAQVDDAGNPIRDGDGRFVRGARRLHRYGKSGRAGARSIRTTSATANGSTRPSRRIRNSTTRRTTRRASSATSLTRSRIS
ncbi:MAG: hypothetical protein DMD87_03620 [Candidatus Rokuibacteriota bacterium]|nr:MAG: hypothetical protein DMD87_03620 [Candidatus Rokubacteria bacterium]